MGAQVRGSRLVRLSRRLDALERFVLGTEHFWHQQYGKEATDRVVARAEKWTCRVLFGVAS